MTTPAPTDPAADPAAAAADPAANASPPAPPPPASPPGLPPPAPPAPPPPWYGADLAHDDQVYLEKTGYKSLADVVKAERHKATLLGVDKGELLRLPKADAPAEAWAEVFTKLGRPENPEGYGLKESAELGLTSADLQLFAGKMHAAGANTKMVQAAIETYAEIVGKLNTATQGANEANDAAFHDWAAKQFGDAKDARLNRIGEVLKAHGGEELATYLDESKLGNDPRLAAFLDKVADLLAEAGPTPASPGGPQFGDGPLTPAQKQAKLEEFETTNHDALNDKNHPRHQWAVAERVKLLG